MLIANRGGILDEPDMRSAGKALTRPTDPNGLWCTDYKGEFMLGNRRYWYPLTITDFASRCSAPRAWQNGRYERMHRTLKAEAHSLRFSSPLLFPYAGRRQSIVC